MWFASVWLRLTSEAETGSALGASAFLVVSAAYLLPGVVLNVKGEKAGGVFAQHIDLFSSLLQLVPAQV